MISTPAGANNQSSSAARSTAPSHLGDAPTRHRHRPKKPTKKQAPKLKPKPLLASCVARPFFLGFSLSPALSLSLDFGFILKTCFRPGRLMTDDSTSRSKQGCRVRGPRLVLTWLLYAWLTGWLAAVDLARLLAHHLTSRRWHFRRPALPSQPISGSRQFSLPLFQAAGKAHNNDSSANHKSHTLMAEMALCQAWSSVS